MKFFPSYTQARVLAREGNVIPVFARIAADLDTPVSTFLKLAEARRRSFMLESIEGGERLARYSFLGFDPFMTVRALAATESGQDGGVEVEIVSEGRTTKRRGAPAEIITEILAEFSPAPVEGIPRFSGGAVGYFGYDTARWFERVPDTNPDIIDMPDCVLDFYQSVVVFDHLKQEILLISNILRDRGEDSFRAKYDAAVDWVRSAANKMEAPLSRAARREDKMARHPKLKAHTTQKRFESIVRRAKKYIKEGDIFQVVLSQRWSAKLASSPLQIYRRLRRLNPSPYMFLLRFGGSSIIGASPEMLARVERNVIETCPIAGTRPRGKTSLEDDRLAKELLEDPKELAEHTMLLDLGRNDIGRVSQAGSVRVTRNMEIERYSHVIHLVSTVEGAKREEVSSLEALFSCFPAGTVSGAPKIRAMEIIDELENCRRGAYAGSIAYLDFWGNVDSCITIRSIVQHEETVYFQAGAGIVADSRPRREFEETEHKARVLFEAVTGKVD